MARRSYHEANLVHHPETALTPEILLRRTLQDVGDIRSVAICMMWKSGHSTNSWSRQNAGDLFQKIAWFGMDVRRRVFPEETDS